MGDSEILRLRQTKSISFRPQDAWLIEAIEDDATGQDRPFSWIVVDILRQYYEFKKGSKGTDSQGRLDNEANGSAEDPLNFE